MERTDLFKNKSRGPSLPRRKLGSMFAGQTAGAGEAQAPWQALARCPKQAGPAPSSAGSAEPRDPARCVATTFGPIEDRGSGSSLLPLRLPCKCCALPPTFSGLLVSPGSPEPAETAEKAALWLVFGKPTERAASPAGRRWVTYFSGVGGPDSWAHSSLRFAALSGCETHGGGAWAAREGDPGRTALPVCVAGSCPRLPSPRLRERRVSGFHHFAKALPKPGVCLVT